MVEFMLALDIIIAFFALLLILVILKSLPKMARFKSALAKIERLIKKEEYAEADLVLLEDLEPLFRKIHFNEGNRAHAALLSRYQQVREEFAQHHRRIKRAIEKRSRR